MVRTNYLDVQYLSTLSSKDLFCVAQMFEGGREAELARYTIEERKKIQKILNLNQNIFSNEIIDSVLKDGSPLRKNLEILGIIDLEGSVKSLLLDMVNLALDIDSNTGKTSKIWYVIGFFSSLGINVFDLYDKKFLLEVKNELNVIQNLPESPLDDLIDLQDNRGKFEKLSKSGDSVNKIKKYVVGDEFIPTKISDDLLKGIPDRFYKNIVDLYKNGKRFKVVKSNYEKLLSSISDGDISCYFIDVESSDYVNFCVFLGRKY